jgi:hypothetical protein
VCVFVFMCVFVTAVPITKLFAWGGGEGGGHVLRLHYRGCVFITAVPITKLFVCVCGERWRTCATRDDEPRPVWAHHAGAGVCVLLLQDLVQSCSRGGGADSGCHVLRETTSRAVSHHGRGCQFARILSFDQKSHLPVSVIASLP